MKAGVTLTEQMIRDCWERESKRGMDPDQFTRVVSPKAYRVLASMVEEKIISGLPYSELTNLATIEEFIRRMNK